MYVVCDDFLLLPGIAGTGGGTDAPTGAEERKACAFGADDLDLEQTEFYMESYDPESCPV